MKIRQRYKINKDAKVGTECVCPSCGTKFVKTNYQQAFCKSKKGTICKDKYWNTVTPNKRNNKTRISPANARYFLNVILPQKAFEYGFPDVETMRNHVEEDIGQPIYVERCKCCDLRYEYCRCDTDFD
jgi:hypothetical protein